MSKDWTGNKKSGLVMLGVNNDPNNDRPIHDYYATEPRAIDLLLANEVFQNVWECACGEGHLSNRLKSFNVLARESDLINRKDNEVLDFLSPENRKWDGDIITNPPYKYSLQFVRKSLEIIPNGHKVAMFLKLQFLEGVERSQFFKIFPPKVVYVSSRRLHCAKNGDFEKYGKFNAVCYAWFVWEKGYKNYPIIKWI